MKHSVIFGSLGMTNTKFEFHAVATKDSKRTIAYLAVVELSGQTWWYDVATGSLGTDASFEEVSAFYDGQRITPVLVEEIPARVRQMFGRELVNTTVEPLAIAEVLGYMPARTGISNSVTGSVTGVVTQMGNVDGPVNLL